MNKALLRSEVQKFIKNYKDDITKLAFKGSAWEDIKVQELIQQIESFKKSKTKLPTWFASKNIYYPPKLNIEQTSSEITAKHKASLVKGETIADITGGFGVDCYYFSKVYKEVHHFEKNKTLSKIAEHNFKELGVHNVVFNTKDGLEAIKNNTYDTIYLDPSRRDNVKGKVYYLKDCEPNVVTQLDFLLKNAKNVLLKTSPMLDISVGLRELKNVSEIHIVAVQNDVKELLWKISNETSKQVLINTININKEHIEKFQFDWSSAETEVYNNPLGYLYEPNASIMKSGGFASLCKAFSVFKLAKHSHLFTSNEKLNFPGRIFKITAVIPYQKSEMKTILGSKANVSTRNFPETVLQLKKKWKIKDGGDRFLFFTTLHDGSKIVIDAQKA